MIFGVLLRDAEVDVEQEPLAGRRRLGPFAIDDLAEPVDMDEPVVVDQAVDGAAVVGCPGAEAAVEDGDVRDAPGLERRGDPGRIQTPPSP